MENPPPIFDEIRRAQEPIKINGPPAALHSQAIYVGLGGRKSNIPSERNKIIQNNSTVKLPMIQRASKSDPVQSQASNLQSQSSIVVINPSASNASVCFNPSKPPSYQKPIR